jgi:putative polyhydroxyalkanoate system protein
MPKIHVEQSHSMEISEVHNKMDSTLKGLAEKYDIDINWKNDREVSLKRRGLKGSAEIQDKRVTVDLDLSFVLAPMKGKIESRLKEKLEKELS